MIFAHDSTLFFQWFDNLISDKLNNEILFLIYNNYRHKDILKILKKNLEQLHQKNYSLVDINKIDSIRDIKQDTNIILIGYSFMNLTKLTNNTKKTLYYIDFQNYFLKHDFLTTYKTYKEIVKSSEKFELGSYERHNYFIEKKDPIEIIYTYDYYNIQNSVFSMFSQWGIFPNSAFIVFSHNELIQSDPTILYPRWKELIENDILVLSTFKILTSRLAVTLYKMCTFKFYDSNTTIGNYYRKTIGVKSKTIQLPNTKPIQKVKAYDLNSLKDN